ncbi:MAG: extracellular solute-binding protein, partial [Oscillospiraceae bacterium]|nr:extracellular solute-binding protein [Oscillospiraceae bacterium]
YRIEPIENNKFLIRGGTRQITPVFYTCDKNLENMTEIDFPDFKTGNSYDISIAKNNTIVQIIANVDYGDLPEPDEFSEDYDAELYENSASYKIFINTYSIDGQLISSNEVSGLYDTINPRNVMFSGIFCSSDGKSCIVNIDNKYYIIDTDGTFRGTLKSDKLFRKFGKSSNGDVICGVDAGDDNMEMYKVNFEKGCIEKTGITYKFPDIIARNFIEGSGEYSFYIPSNKTVYGVKASDNSIEPVFDVTSSGVNTHNLNGFLIDEKDNCAIIITNDYARMSVKTTKFKECDPSEIENISKITLGVSYMDDFMKEFIADFNDSQTDYHVELKDYSEYESKSNITGDREQLALDIISDNAPDIIMMSNFIDEYHLDEKGALTDLYEFMKNDKDFNKNNLIPNIAEQLEKDGHLYAIPNSFYISQDYVKSKFNDKSDFWTTQDYMDAIENIADDMSVYYYNEQMTKYQVWANLLDLDSFISEDYKTCSFDSDEYINLLEFADKYPNEEELEYKSEFNWDNMTEAEKNEYVANQSLCYQRETVLINDSRLESYQSYFVLKKGDFGGDEISAISQSVLSIPETFAISAQSKNKEFAWDFMKQFFTDNFYHDENNRVLIYGFPVTKSGLEYMAEKAKEPVENADTDYTGYYFYGDAEIGLPDDEDIAEMNNLINTAIRERSYNYNVHNIIYEEVYKFFHGDYTAEQCAKATQDRISIYLAENN